MIKELHEKIQRGEITSLELTKGYIKTIDEKNDNINALLEVYKEDALREAKKVDEEVKSGNKIGMLSGIPGVLKDNICVKGNVTSAASKMLENYIAPYDATVVKKLRREKIVLLGKANLDEFAMGASTENSAFGVTKNPHDTNRVAGGSSGGSTAVVAADMAVWALGSDTGGSIRQPASFCGTVGLKPTYGRVSRYGLIAMASSYDQIGPITKTVEDAAIVFDVITGKDEKDNTTADKKTENFFENLKPELKGKKIGIIKKMFEEGLNGDVRNVIEKRIEFAKEQGAEIVEIELPHLKYAMSVYYLMVPSEVSSNMARLDGMRFGLCDATENVSKNKSILDIYKNSREAGFGAEVKRRIILGTYALSAGYYDAFYKKAQQVREIIKHEINEVFNEVDIILTPTSPDAAFKIGERGSDPLAMYLEDIYTVSANVAMVPAISIPAGTVKRDDKDLPIGLQLIAKWWNEQELLNVALAMELK
ncbi:Asp-tRNA(Asn)/Glu-tRNA(Gln) amidotransferase subunit GatA [bacterium]|jgi:aspartyl-tRNA(Asn)/glutamyl-tRNA(Gln) amidotransferase subunit A|nr:Asp-tRNA(Asn)/Glu-tRNA(Gln) amidotransferase subunit GatA [bacterium]MBT4251464.1 Asp-tRNA(Asn)/Glu-tRNA(Gln) amidotransferase subunit GatA [bacterium]MBT4597438.1 Asp-tRNA(Asn)/Glu-tRNA(Gln) amidotransferase subunit GatA [bacterium]MBT6754277.1 Asp-tRNA(Asn)/Glu-tRNA(Gln) amidotransferase subunit GatA [bacterium]MBT7037603.1 Asp-tRNA(Asn)/Glu-tRNA(Gln) amidotransferase subunit GatA [bacterium]